MRASWIDDNRGRLSPAQFKASEYGPDAATRLSDTGGETAEPFQPLAQRQQQHLFDPNTVPRAEPHQQTQQQFADDPRTWWHGRYQHPKLSGLYAKDTHLTPAAGIHIGTKQAATDRLEHLGEPRDVYHPHTGEDYRQSAGRLFPLRVTGKVSNTPLDPEEDQGSKWESLSDNKGRYYENDVEDRGNISMRVPGLHHVMSHRQFVEKAVKGGKDVHPIIAAEAKQKPDYNETFQSKSDQTFWRNTKADALEARQHKLFNKNDVQWPGEGQERSRQLEFEHRDDVLRRKDPGLHAELQKLGEALG